MLRRSCSLFFTLVLTSAALADAHAAELGDTRVLSHVGQQLVADIELAMIDDPATQVAVRVASPEVYNGAGVALPSVLPSLNLTVMRRDGRQFLHVTSLRPVAADHLHLYLELTDKGQRTVRLVTLWLTPDPNPASLPAPVSLPAPLPAPAVSASTLPASASASVHAAAPPAVAAPRPALARIAAPRTAAAPAPASSPLSTPAPAPALATAQISAPASAPAAPSTAPLAKSAAQPPAGHKKPLLVLPIHKPALPAVLHDDSKPGACTPGEAQACSALGTKNAALRAQLSQLEDKVKGLQKILGVAPLAAPAAAPVADMNKNEPPKADAPKTGAPKAGEHPAVAHPAEQHPPEQHGAEGDKPAAAPAEAKPPEPKPAPPAAPKPISSIKPLVPHKPKTAPPEEGGAPWGAIAAGVGLLAALGGGGAFLLKRRARRSAAMPAAPMPAAPGLLGKLKARFAGRPGAPSSAAGTPEKVIEPTMQ
jgi:hypothetical protein